MSNEYSRQWFEVFLDSMPEEWTSTEVDGVARRLPLPEFQRVLDICCGPGRHAQHLSALGYEITGVDRDPAAIEQARACVPGARFLVLDQRELAELPGQFDAAVILWQSYGYFDAEDNDEVLRAVADLMRPGGRLLLDLFHPEYFEQRQGRTTDVRHPRCAAITNTIDRGRLTSTIEYADGEVESMDWELFSPTQIADRAGRAGLREVERCSWWDEGRPPDSNEQRFQLVLEKV